MKVAMTEEHRIPKLVERSTRGDRSAFEELMLLSRERLESFIRSRIRSQFRKRIDIPALASDTLGRAFQALERFTGGDEDAWFAWLAGIAKKVVLKEIQYLNRDPGFQIDREIESDHPSPSHALRREERYDRLRAALQKLSPDHREVIRLCRIDGLKIREAASRLGRSPSAVKMLLSRALLELKEKFGDTESLHLPHRRLQLEGDEDAG
jgi:RNA polymerase sigma-70 factor (ECF subfamily)